MFIAVVQEKETKDLVGISIVSENIHEMLELCKKHFKKKYKIESNDVDTKFLLDIYNSKSSTVLVKKNNTKIYNTYLVTNCINNHGIF